jgi:hypothetical protein
MYAVTQNLLSCSICSPKTTVDVSPELAWLLVLHAHVDHGIPMEMLEQMYLGVAPSGTKTWKLPRILSVLMYAPTSPHHQPLEAESLWYPVVS